MWGRGGGTAGTGRTKLPQQPCTEPVLPLPVLPAPWGAHPQPAWHTWLHAAPEPNLSLLRGSKLPALGAPQCSWDCQALAGCLQAPAGVISCTIRDMGTHRRCWSWQSRAFCSPSCLQKEKGSGGRAASPRHTQGTQERGRDVLSVTRHAGRLGQAVPAGTRLPARASTALPRAKGAPGHCQKSVGRRARGWHCCGLHGARLGLLQHPWMLLEVDEHCVTISAPSLQAWRSRCPGIPLHQGPENSSPHPVGPHRPGREERTPATQLLAGQGD